MGRSSQLGGYDALDYSKIKQDADQLGSYAILAATLLDFCLSFMLIDLKFSTYHTCLTTGVTLMCTELLKMMGSTNNQCQSRHIHIIIAKCDFSDYSYYVNYVFYMNYDKSNEKF